MVTLHISASAVHCTDLDEMSGCLALRDELRNKLSSLQNVGRIELDLAGCWLDYGFSHLYLDEAISALAKSPVAERELSIDVSVDLGAREYMAALLFPQTTLFVYQPTQGPNVLSQNLDNYLALNGINLEIRSSISSAENLEKVVYSFGKSK
jgi:hypothetical protein